MEHLRLTSLTFVTDTEVDVVVEGDDGSSATWRFVVDESRGFVVVDGPPEFASEYRQTPPIIPSLAWPELLVAAAYRARVRGLLAGRMLDWLIRRHSDWHAEAQRLVEARAAAGAPPGAPVAFVPPPAPRTPPVVDDVTVIGECLAAVADGPFVPDREMHTVMGLYRVEVRSVARNWPATARDDIQDLAVGNSLNNLLRYPHRRWDVWPEFVSVSPKDVRAVESRWRRARGEDPVTDYFDGLR